MAWEKHPPHQIYRVQVKNIMTLASAFCLRIFRVLSRKQVSDSRSADRLLNGCRKRLCILQKMSELDNERRKSELDGRQTAVLVGTQRPPEEIVTQRNSRGSEGRERKTKWLWKPSHPQGHAKACR